MKNFHLRGKVFYKNVGTGAWGIRDMSGQEWRPINMPEQLKAEGAEVNLFVREVEEDFSMHMWGTPVEILNFHTLPIM